MLSQPKISRKNVIKTRKLIDGTATATVARDRKINTKLTELTVTNPPGMTNPETAMLTVTVRIRGINPVCMRTVRGQSQRLGWKTAARLA